MGKKSKQISFKIKIALYRNRAIDKTTPGKWQDTHLFIREDIRPLHLHKYIKKLSKNEATRIHGPISRFMYKQELISLCKKRELVEKIYRLGA